MRLISFLQDLYHPNLTVRKALAFDKFLVEHSRKNTRTHFMDAHLCNF